MSMLARRLRTSTADAGEISRSNVAGYVDLGLDVTDKWYVGTAARYERYTQDIGSTWSGKFSTRYAFTDAFAVRGTINNGFRAPSLANSLFSARSTTYGVVNGVYQSINYGVLPVDSAAAKAFARYLQAAADFYSGRFSEAERGFAAAGSSDQPWLAHSTSSPVFQA